MKDFNSYSGEQKNKAQPSNKSDVFSIFSQLAGKYEGKSSDEMMQAIIKEAEKSRRNGTLSDSDIDNFVSSVAPILNSSQQKMLVKISERLKQIK